MSAATGWVARLLQGGDYVLKHDFLVAPDRYASLAAEGTVAGFVIAVLTALIPRVLGRPFSPFVFPHWCWAVFAAPTAIGGVVLAVNPTPCESYVLAGIEKCRWDCGLVSDELRSGCEARLRGGSLASTAARRGSGVCEQIGVICEERHEAERQRLRVERREALSAAIISGSASQFCDSYMSAGSRGLCQALVQIASTGRSSRKDKKALREHLVSFGFRNIGGFIVARHDKGLYEAARLSDTMWGWMPSGRHFLLKTSLTEYSTKGRFNLWVRLDGVREITTTGGFQQTWDVYEESALGSLILMVFAAPAGEPTSSAARELLLALAE
jgi:hypothetical protein